MDPIAVTVLTNTVWTLLQPHLKTIAAKSAEKVGELLPETIGKLWGQVMNKFKAKPAAKEAAGDLLKHPDDADLQAAFRVQLKKALERDPAFAEQIKELVEQVGPQTDVRVRDGAAAVGAHAKAVGTGGILIEGSVKGNVTGAGTRDD